MLPKMPVAESSESMNIYIYIYIYIYIFARQTEFWRYNWGYHATQSHESKWGKSFHAVVREKHMKTEPEYERRYIADIEEEEKSHKSGNERNL